EKIITMARSETVAVGSTGLQRVQFGVPPNWIGKRETGVDQINNGASRPPTVSGATPETTRETRVLHNSSAVALADDMILNQ
ncbi:MAG: hypothetical protein ACREDQ_08210, partial [Limisphaerales bacterium]